MAYAGLAQRLTAQNPKIVVSWLKRTKEKQDNFYRLRCTHFGSRESG